jgi:hypothetical protein
MFETKVVNKIKTHFLCSITFFLNRALLEIMWRNTLDPSRPQMTIWRIRVTCWYLSLRKHTLRIYMILIAYPLRLIFMIYVHCLICLFDAWDGGYFYAMCRCAQKSTYFHVKSRLLFSDSNASGIRKQYFLEFFNIKVNENVFTSQSGTCVHTERRMDGRSEG